MTGAGRNQSPAFELKVAFQRGHVQVRRRFSVQAPCFTGPVIGFGDELRRSKAAGNV